MSERRVVLYTTVVAERVAKLDEMVNCWITEGWEVYGERTTVSGGSGIGGSGIMHYQTMVKYDSNLNHTTVTKRAIKV